MALTLEDLLDGLRCSRKHFLKHVDGLKADQWTWKPYPECKSIHETLSHLICDDRAALYSLETGKEPDYEAMYGAIEGNLEQLRSQLNDSHATLCAFIQERYADAPLDQEISFFGHPMKLFPGISALSLEDYYHAGQVAFIRMATDPTWDYYAAIYG